MEYLKLDEIELSEKDFERERIKSSLLPLSQALNYYDFGNLVIISARSGAGKSTFVSQEMAFILDQNYKIGAFSGELTPTHFKRWFYEQLVSDSNNYKYKYDDYLKRNARILKPEIIEGIDNFYKDKVTLLQFKDGIAQQRELFVAMKKLNDEGIRVFAIDNLMQIEVSENEKFEAQITFLHKLKQFCKEQKVLVFLVAHPKKVRDEFICMDDISGKQELFAKVDIVLLLHRISEERKSKELIVGQTNVLFGIDELIEVAKNRDDGSLVKIATFFDRERRRFYSRANVEEKEYISKFSEHLSFIESIKGM